jgi:ureidoglycolate hydrolase|tara:strand:- start:248 stop:526 length:279 start_codon:yes stop_codon:yes gene_type:complete
MGELGKVSYQRKGEAFVQYGTIIDVGILDKRSGEVFKNAVSWINYLDFKRIQNSREVPWSIINTNKIIDYEHYTIIVAPKTDYELLYSSDIY